MSDETETSVDTDRKSAEKPAAKKAPAKKAPAKKPSHAPAFVQFASTLTSRVK